MRIPCPASAASAATTSSPISATRRLRPARSADAPLRGVARLRLPARQPGRRARELWYHGAGCRRWLVVTRDTRPRHPSVASADGRANARPTSAGPRSPSGTRQPHRLPHGRADRSRRSRCRSRFDGRDLSRASPATRSPRRCWPTACGWSAARSNITGRAASCRAGPEEPNALVELRAGARREPNTRGTTVELYDGLEADEPEPLAVAALRSGRGQRAARAVPRAGFYYKTFMWPAAFWERLYEPLIRRAAGLGRARGEPDPDRYEQGIRASATCW